MPPQFVFTMKDVCKEYGERRVLEGISLSYYYGAKIGIVGDNGAGKSTLLRIMAGVDTDFHGEADLAPNMRVCYVPQEPQLNPEKDVRGNLEEATAPIQALVDRYDEVMVKMGESLPESEMDALMQEMGDLQDKIDALDAWEIDRLLDIASDALVLPPDDADVRTLSGGEIRRVALCKALLEKADLLLLDEPTNHLDAETIAWLQTALSEYPGTVIIVTHDRYFLDQITKWILELEKGRGLPFEGNYSSWLQQKAELLRRMEKRESQRQKFLKREYDWIHNSPKWRLQRNRNRIQRYDELAGQAFDIRKDEVSIQIPPGPRLGEQVLKVDGVCKAFDDLTVLDNCSFDLPRGAIVGVVGPNGAGKTTLFRMIIGDDAPDSGTVTLGSTVELAYVDQMRDTLNDDLTVFEEIADGEDEIDLGSRRIKGRAYVARFNFRGGEQQKRVGSLSGGERNRVHLAKLLRRGGNLLLLDEPTNDLDVNTLRVLEEGLSEFTGCALVISHDRFFLDRICTHLLIFEGHGKVTWFDGNFGEYEEQVLQADGAARYEQRRARYKKLSLR
jgi:ATP-binding cassette ChvD family protein